MAIKYVFNPFTGKFDAVDIAIVGVPIFNPAGTTFSVDANYQRQYSIIIDNEGVLDLAGVLDWVD